MKVRTTNSNKVHALLKSPQPQKKNTITAKFIYFYKRFIATRDEFIS